MRSEIAVWGLVCKVEVIGGLEASATCSTYHLRVLVWRAGEFEEAPNNDS